MDQGWATVLLLAFGIVVGVIGVIAYLRMLRKDKTAFVSSRPDAPPAGSNGAEEAKDSEHTFIKD
ncbi:hypothetical protein [Paenibacillus soyae]|uniref:Uncharacterized protein n=1 Tax=Paenibacillus soyae TaxID=2969249 RepID=A0A9X2SBV2_9BACL|nr:hypothetical protein [Paenibacillus soyae]MCR2806048.1 hypothetical protein [Paenibacillus soyae]